MSYIDGQEAKVGDKVERIEECVCIDAMPTGSFHFVSEIRDNEYFELSGFDQQNNWVQSKYRLISRATQESLRIVKVEAEVQRLNFAIQRIINIIEVHNANAI